MTLLAAPPPPAPAPPASEETRRSNSEDRWARWAVKGARRDFISQRRFQIIAGIIAAGVTAWLIWTSVL